MKDPTNFGLAAIVYAVLVLSMWGAFGLGSGFNGETAFPYMSETGTVIGGFLYQADPLRIHTNSFYHLSYLASEAFGVRGSYIPYQVVYALLWWARGFLVFLILKKFLPGFLFLCYAAGALTIIHASDGALQWIGQLNQFGFIFWMLLAFYLLILAVDAPGRKAAAILTAGACFFEYMSLWSYESQLPILAALPASLYLQRRWRKKFLVYAAWLSVPVIYVALAAQKFANSGGQTYQESVMRRGGTWGNVLADWFFNVAASLEFWTWSRGADPVSQREAYILSSISVLAFIAGGAALIRLTREQRRPDLFAGNPRVWWTLLAAGFLWVTLSFPVYLMLASSRMLWRTQFLSGVGAALVFTALCGFATHVFRRESAKGALFLTLGGVIVFYGSVSAIQKSAFHRSRWDLHRNAMEEILRVAPSVRPNTVVVLKNVPQSGDPFGHNMWLDLSVRLAYPGIPVAATYFYEDGTSGPGANLKAAGNEWKWDGTGIAPMVPATSLASTIVVDYQASGRGKLGAAFPAYMCPTSCAMELYRPDFVITGPVSPIARRRYRIN